MYIKMLSTQEELEIIKSHLRQMFPDGIIEMTQEQLLKLIENRVGVSHSCAYTKYKKLIDCNFLERLRKSKVGGFGIITPSIFKINEIRKPSKCKKITTVKCELNGLTCEVIPKNREDVFYER